jgi:hypothetical protein
VESRVAILADCHVTSLFQPKKPHGQLPQIIPRMTNGQLARSPQQIGGMSPERRVVG